MGHVGDLRKTGMGSLCLALILAGAAGCHGDTNQGGGTDNGGAAQPRPKAAQNTQVPTPPSADRVDPNSPEAVLNGTSTAQPGSPKKPSPKPPPVSRPTGTP